MVAAADFGLAPGLISLKQPQDIGIKPNPQNSQSSEGAPVAAPKPALICDCVVATTALNSIEFPTLPNLVSLPAVV